jgi:hypothetical protein
MGMRDGDGDADGDGMRTTQLVSEFHHPPPMTATALIHMSQSMRYAPDPGLMVKTTCP